MRSFWQLWWPIISCINDAGYSDLSFSRIYCFFTAGSRNELEGVYSDSPFEGVYCSALQGPQMACRGCTSVEDTQKDSFPLKEHLLFCCRNSVRGTIWGLIKTFAPDLLRSMMKQTDPVQEELRRILSKLSQINRDPSPSI